MSKIESTKSSGNVFADMGFEDAKEYLVKARLALRINLILKKRKLKQIQAAKILGVSQPKISAIANGRLDDFSIEKLCELLNKLDQDIEIVIHQKPKNIKRQAIFRVAVA